MGGLFGALAGALDRKSAPAAFGSQDLWLEMLGARMSGSGVAVNIDTALQVATVLACCKVRGEGIAQVPWKLFQKVGDRRRVAIEHPVYDLIHRRPNRLPTTSFDFRETLVLHMMLAKGAYVYLSRSANGELLEMLLYPPGCVTVRRKPDMSLTYQIRMEGGSLVDVPASNMWHLHGLSWNGWEGLDPVKLAREAIGLSIATESSQARQHKDGLKQSGTYSIEGSVDIDQHAKMMTWLRKYNDESAGLPLILDRGAKWLQTQMSGVDAQHIETRKHQVEEVCRAFRVMPIMVGQSDKAATYASAEQMFLAHVVHTLMPWYERIEQSADINLLSDSDRAAGYYTKFIPNALMRGAAKDRGDYYSKALGSGGQKPWMTADEVRDLEELDPMGGHAAELGEGAMQPAGAGGGSVNED